ncbi:MULTISPECIES: S66 peptidase family protein [Nostocales]|uniref:LD-carboxypeptidase n=3 Tax=Nostocales TaxID=1161 RepID=A0A0C1QZ65_9CYAN|nr:LD-carboxypeptidase [Tolypothrix bouteillei]KAF3885419.1 LD-carboxypeptidase [Tolypothrix bouteillei VB521301]
MSNAQYPSKIVPQSLKPGDLLQVISPSGALREFESFQKGVEIWRSRGYQVELASGFDDKWGYLAGQDENRRHQLATAWQKLQCRGILCARGGFGSARILEDWVWTMGELSPSPSASQAVGTPSPLLTNPKWLIGFSDITALLWSLYTVGISSVHGPVMTTLASEPEWSIQRLFDLVEGRPLAPLEGDGWGGGIASGILLPANLTVATHLLGTPLQPDMDGVILAWEDVTEAPYRIDRLLTQWRMSGALQKVRGIALGRFSRCEPPPNVPSFTIEEVLRDRLGNLGIPVVSGLPFGHDGPNAALPVGVKVTLDADRGLLDCTQIE